jgi:hypothetical protein
MSTSFGIRLIAVGPNHLEVLRLVRALCRDNRKPSEVKAELANGLPMVLCENLDYFDVPKVVALFEKAGATVEPYVSASEYPGEPN